MSCPTNFKTLKFKWLFILVFLIANVSSLAQNVTVSGYVEDAATGEKLIGANIYDQLSSKGTATNAYGFYSLTLPKGKTKLQYSFIGFQSNTQSIDLRHDTLINISISSTVNLKEVQIIANEAQKIQEKVQMSTIDISMDKVESLPALFGEKDIMKTIQLMPGVQSGGEGSSSLYVRGGGPDQNLLLLDGVPIYNASHLFGFFSVFNSDAINTTTLIKGGFPARYGGRLSSVIDIRMKEGNTKKLHGSGGIGIISSRLTLEGPIKSEKTTFLVSGRRTYIDILTRPLITAINKSNGTDGTGGYFFYDLNAKINHRFSDKDRLYISGYLGNDKFYYIDKNKFETHETSFKSGLQWGNIIGAIRWNHVFTNKLFSNLTANYSRYKFLVSFENEEIYNGELIEDFEFKYFSGIEDLSAKWEFDYFPSPNHQIKFGVNNTYHHFSPGVSLLKQESFSESLDTVLGEQHQYSNEAYIYLEDEFSIGSRLKATLGLHASGFIVQKRHYYSIQPRFTGRYMINEKVSVKAAYSYMTQYLHLLSNPSIGLPTDLWVPVTKNIPPQNSHQIAGGIASSVFSFLELSIEGYYKTMENLVSYKDGASFYTGTDWQKKVEIGNGWSYGMEVLLEKKVGKTSGWIGYTLSWTNRQFKKINFGEKYPYRYDRRHDVGIAITHKINDKIDMGATWVYGTGKAITLGTQVYDLPVIDDNFPDNFPPTTEVEHISARNNYREPSFHRLDFGINFRKEKKWGERIWNISIYNAYSRLNPFYLYLSEDFKDQKIKLYQASLFPIIPSVSYSFKF